MLISDLSQYMGPTGPVLPTGMPYGEYHLTGPNQYVYTEEPDERVIPSTPFSGSRSPLPVPWRGTMFVSPSLGHDSRCSTPAQESYHPPHSPGALPVTPGDVPNVIPVDPSVGGPPPHQTIINIPRIGVPPPGHMVEPGIPVQSSPPAHPVVAVQPSLQGVPTRPIVTHPPFPGPSVPVSESIHVPSRASSRTCTYYAPMPSECGVRDRRPSFSMEDAPEPPRRYPSSASAMGGDRRSPQRMPSRGDAPMLPADLDSSPSSPSSGTLTYFDSSRRSESASHRDSQTTTNGSGSSHGHLLARLVSLEKEVRKINAAAAVTTERPEAETSCANVAERRVLDYFHGMRIAVENRHHAEQESARLREELKLHKLQLEEVQKESQNVLKQVDSLRKEAEAEAVRARITARKLQEEMLVMLAREEGRRGNQERLSMVRRIGYVEEHHEGDENIPELGKATLDEERNDPRSHIQLRSAASTRQQPIRSEWAPPIRTFDTSSYVPPLPVRVHTPSHEHRTPSPPRDLDEPETIHPIPIRPSLIISSQPSVPIDDGWIPRADSGTSYIRLPPPDELRQPTPPSPSSVATEVQDRRATQQSPPTPVSPPVRSRDYVYQPSVPPPISRGHTPSIASRTSTHVSQYDVVNECPGSSLRNEIYVGRVRSGSQPSRESTSQNEHRDQDRHHSSRTEVESIADQWRADDAASPPRNPPRLLTPSAVSRPHQPSRIYYPQPGFHYRAWKLVVPRPSGMSRIKE
ncbi:hypothetical protein OG21DRAFT_904565 [Imleria badia]|nr:hypothetical protein OG21DRAFT_904565 [Imleria badia]